MSSNLDNNSLERALATRNAIVDRLNRIVATIEESETSKTNLSGKLELESAIADLKNCSDKLASGVFRLLVLGDVKRGKSTVINALIGEDLLPRDVNACTAILTVLRYGLEKKVTVYFHDDTTPESLDFDAFKQQYSISPDEAKKLEDEGQLAFPNVREAVIEYPLPLLKFGVEIIDSPGLNDTAARNQLTLDYIYNCNAILFVLRAVQPFSLAERRYLNNYIKDRGLDIFFLINGWDEINNSLLEPDNPQELAAAQERSQNHFRNALSEYLPAVESEESDIYQERVFTISALNALRSNLDNSTIDIASTGFDIFANALNNFLTEERVKTEFKQAEIVTQQVYNRLHEAVVRRISLLSESQEDVRQKIDNVAPDFVRLQELQAELQQEIKLQAKSQAKKIAASFEEYVLKLEDTFIIDFQKYQPHLDTWDFLSSSKREDFNRSFKLGFDRYLTDKLLEWDRQAERDLAAALQELVTSLESYSESYHRITDNIDIKLVGSKTIYLNRESQTAEELDWKNWTIGCIALAGGNIGGIALASAGVDWRQVLINWVSVIGISRFIAIFTGVFLNPYSVLLVSLGLAGVQTSFARQEFVKLTKQEFIKYLPKIAQEQKPLIEEKIFECFAKYERLITKRIDRDIKARQAEIANLVPQQEMTQSDRAMEIDRLQNLDESVLGTYQEINSMI